MKHFLCKLRSEPSPTAILAEEISFTETECQFYRDGEIFRTISLADLERTPVVFEQSIPAQTWDQFVADSKLEDGWKNLHGEN